MIGGVIGGVIEGVALVGGQALANLEFTIGGYPAGTPGRSSFDTVSVRTDSAGRFRVEGLEEFDGNLYPKRVRPDGGMQDALFVPVEIRNNEVTEVEIDFVEGISSIEGTVFYANEDNPIQARFELIFTWNEAGVYNEEIIRSRTDEAGNFRIGGLPAGNAEVHTFATVNGKRFRLVSNIRLGQGEHVVKNIVISAAIVKCDVANIPENTKQMFVLAHPGEFDLQVTDISSFIQARDSMVAVSRHSGRTSKVTAFLNGLTPGRYTISAMAWPTEYNLAEITAYGVERFFNDMKHIRTYITIETTDQEIELYLDFATMGEQ